MNIDSLISKISLFNELVVTTGFKRDVDDFINSIQQSHNQNIQYMKELSNNLLGYFDEFDNHSLNDELEILLKDSKPFTSFNTPNEIKELINNPEIEAQNYFNIFNKILNNLSSNIKKNKSEVDGLHKVFSKYVSTDEELFTDDEKGVISLIFKDLSTTKSLKEFSFVLNRWNRDLLLYHQLVKSSAPKEITLVQVQNGSIDVIFNIDIQVALDFGELVKTGLKAYSAYLLYKSKLANEIVQTYLGNKKLIESEAERERLMLENIKDSIHAKALEQHQNRAKKDKAIESSGTEMKAKQISLTLSDHFVKGNELKLLIENIPEENSSEDNDEDSSKNDTSLAGQIKKETANIRKCIKSIPDNDMKQLRDRYSIKKDNEET